MAYERWSRNWDSMGLDEQAEYRDRKLSRFIRKELYPNSQRYRALFDDNGIDPAAIKGVEDLRKVPFTYREDLVAEALKGRGISPSGIMQGEMGQGAPGSGWSRFTRTMNRWVKGEDHVRQELYDRYGHVRVQYAADHYDEPHPLFYTRHDLDLMAEAGRRGLELAGFGSIINRADSVVMNLTQFSPEAPYHMSVAALDRASIFFLDTGGGRVLSSDETLNIFEEIRANALVGMPDYIRYLLERGAEKGVDFSDVRVIVLNGQIISRANREEVVSAAVEAGIEEPVVVSTYSFAEARKGYSECALGTDAGYHLYPDLDYLEIIDPATGEPVREGEGGEIVFTSLSGYGNGLLRFRTGDYVEGGITCEPCPGCGRTVPRLGPDIEHREIRKWDLETVPEATPGQEDEDEG